MYKKIWLKEKDIWLLWYLLYVFLNILQMTAIACVENNKLIYI